MQYDIPDRVSTRSRGSVSTVFSSIWPKIPSSSRKISSDIASICSYINTTSDAGLAPITELIVRKEEGGVQHEFVLIRLAKPTGEDFWMRLERVPKGPLHKLVSSLSKANDTVSAVQIPHNPDCEWVAFLQVIFSGKIDPLLGDKQS